MIAEGRVSGRLAVIGACVAWFFVHPNGAYAAGPAAGKNCAALAHQVFADAKVIAVNRIAAGKFRVPVTPGDPADLAERAATLPDFCRVQALSSPSPDSRIHIEVWLPIKGWNGRFLGTGNGGAAGSIAYGMGMMEGLKRGFAVANTDLGTGPDINQLDDHPERWIDFGHRATHEMTWIAKSFVRTFYGARFFRSYFEGCSTGGQQALVTAQRYPLDYDGILAGAPGSNRTHSANYFLWNYQATNVSPLSRLLPAQWSMVTRRVLDHCVGKDGGAPGDRFLTDPRLCRFDPAMLPQCGSGEAAANCLTDPQLSSVRRLYAGPVNPRTGERIYAGLPLGSEDQSLGPIRMTDPNIISRLFVMRWGMGSAFSPANFDFDRDVDQVDARLSSTLNANDSDLNSFKRHGGKLMVYSGLADAGVPFDDVIAYYDRVIASRGLAEGRKFARLFLVPGMGHCLGGPGVTDIGQPFSSQVPANPEGDALMALVAWTEKGAAPDRLLASTPASKDAPARERPICAYPAFPEYKGGDPARATAFACVNHSVGASQVPARRYLN